ncbi:hypothetical protein KI387_029640, partial [Taxus chinensis]
AVWDIRAKSTRGTWGAERAANKSEWDACPKEKGSADLREDLENLAKVLVKKLK